METFDVIWRGESAGMLSDARNDMGFLEGKFQAAATDHARAFSAMASALDARSVIRDYTKGGRAELISSADGTGRRWTVVVLTLAGADLAVYWPYDKEKIVWIEANVPK
jgi:hypothetical protein